MRRLRTRSQSKRLRALVVSGAIVALSVMLIVSSSMGWVDLSFLAVVPRYTVVPVKNFIEKTKKDFHTLFVDSTELASENIRLLAEIERLQLELSQMGELRLENQRMKGLLNIADSGEYEYEAAQVVAMTPGSWFIEFTINKGEIDGLAVGMPVVTPAGLVGKITGVSAGMSVVRSIVNTRSSLAVIVERTRDNGVVNGALRPGGGSNLLQMAYLPSETELMIGDRILSSGLEGEYPKGLLVGTVKEVPRGSGSFVTVAPAADFLRIEEVLVITNTIKGDNTAISAEGE